MLAGINPLDMLAQEARAMLTRLARVRPFVLHETMVPAAALSPAALRRVERYLADGRREMHDRVHEFVKWLASPEGRRCKPADAQRRFAFLKLRFNAVLSQFDIFADAITQRSEHDTGVWLAGLDIAAADALALPGGYYQPPPLLCYLDRGHGAAIRRARTRLPGGGENPVAIVRIPRERMVGSGIASSLVHEVGHQASALMDLIDSMRPVLRDRQGRGRGQPQGLAWQLFERWISEILADFWAVGRVGVAATMGLIGVVSLPRAFVFRVTLDDPHPFPWIRVKISSALGAGLYPHPQWPAIDRMWEAFYPPDALDEERRGVIKALQANLPELVALIVEHRPKALRGATLKQALRVEERQPARLAELFRGWRSAPATVPKTAPALAFAVIGQARANGTLTPEAESNLVARCLTTWAMTSVLEMPMVADAFPLLNGLKEVHLILAEGAHNQFGDLPWTARIEMLIEQWLLSRPEMREFLHGRAMVPYKEPWMGQVDAMRKVQGWGDTSITHFQQLAEFGEQVLLSVRYGDWIDVHSEDNARNWARYWKPEIQSYIHDYRAVTSVDLAAEVGDPREAQRRFLPPAVHLRNQLSAQRQPAMAALPSFRR